MTTNDSTASSTEKKAVAEQETNIYKTLFMVTALVTALLAGACVLAAGAAAEPATGVRPIEADSPVPGRRVRVGVVPRLRRRARARRRPRDDVPGGVVRLDRVSCVGHAGHALLPRRPTRA